MAEVVSGPAPTVLDPAAFRARQLFDVEIEPGTIVRVRKLDMITMVMENVLPMPMLKAMTDLMAMREEIRADPSKFLEIPETTKAATVELLRRYACAAVVSPVVVSEDDNHPQHLPVALLSMEQLMAIWSATPPGSEVTPVVAERFRGAAPTDDGAVARDGEDVRPEALQLADGRRIIAIGQ